MPNVTVIIRTVIAVLIVGLIIAVKVLYDDNKELTGKNVDLTSQVNKYKILMEDVVKDETLKQKINDEVNNNTTEITDSFNNLKKQLNDVLYESMNDCPEKETPNKPTTGGGNKPPTVPPKQKETVKKVSDLIGEAWCVLDKQREGCVK